ncbi:hypothetical protein [Dyella sp. 2YAF14]|uniref:hypothetical protein n=1 Tax=Dyella sp. 2YAF14 TaxID=3233025 RepID=UPI003F9078D6
MEELDGNVRLAVFIDKLAALKAALAETDHLRSKDGSASVDFVVSELSHNSPAMVGVTAVAINEVGNPRAVIGDFLTFLGQVGNRTVEAASERAKLVGHLRKLVAGVGERFSRLWLDGPSVTPIHLDAAIAHALEAALPDVRHEFGTIKGVVKRYSGVGKQPYFKIVPPVGGVEIKCVFPPSLLVDAAASVEHNATIDGDLKYYEDDLWPHEVHVRGIDIHPNDDGLPLLSDLQGSVSNATGELSAAEFVRELRNEW